MEKSKLNKSDHSMSTIKRSGFGEHKREKSFLSNKEQINSKHGI